MLNIDSHPLRLIISDNNPILCVCLLIKKHMFYPIIMGRYKVHNVKYRQSPSQINYN